MTTREPVSHLSNAELAAMTGDLDALHHDLTLPALRDSVAEWAEEIREREAAGGNEEPQRPALAGRRRFLIGTGGVAGAVLLAACGSSGGAKPSASPSSSGSSGGSGATAATAGGEGQHLSGDLQVVAMASSLESSGIATYMAGIKAATAGKLGTVPPAIVTFAQTAMSQHEDHRQAWNSVLTSAGKKPVTAVDPVIQPSINTALGKVTSVTALAALALMVENIAGETYQNGLSVITSPAGIKTAAAIQPVEFQHAAILSFVLGKYPVPSAFTGVTSARPPSDYRT
jgi:hypothetical protein